MFETQPTRPQAYDKQLLNWLLILIVIFAGLRSHTPYPAWA